MNWKTEALQGFYDNNKIDSHWHKIVCQLKNEVASIHLAIFSEELLNKLIKGEKKLESRFSTHNISPHGRIKKGDIVLVKKSGGPVCAVFLAGEVCSYQNLSQEKVNELKLQFSKALGLLERDKFWKEKMDSKYATFIKVDNIIELEPYVVNKKDRTGWVILKQKNSKMLF